MGVTVNPGQTVSITNYQSGNLVSSGGTLDVLSGGNAVSDTVYGTLNVSSGGLADQDLSIPEAHLTCRPAARA